MCLVTNMKQHTEQRDRKKRRGSLRGTLSMFLRFDEVSEQVNGQWKHYRRVLLRGDRIERLQHRKLWFRKSEVL